MLYIKANENKAKKLFEDLGADKRNKVVRNYWARYGEDGEWRGEPGFENALLWERRQQLSGWEVDWKRWVRDKACQEECLVNPLALGWDPKLLHLINQKKTGSPKGHRPALTHLNPRNWTKVILCC